jgi:GTP-binding protein
MVDSVLLLVDAQEGPMPQTRFVTRKALALGLKPIVVVNKIDRPGARADWAINPPSTCSTSSAPPTSSWTSRDLRLGPERLRQPGPEARDGDMEPLFDAILKHVPARKDDPDARCNCRSPRWTTPPTSARSASAASAGRVKPVRTWSG